MTSTNKTTTVPGIAHSHVLTSTDKATAALAARITELEGVTVNHDSSIASLDSRAVASHADMQALAARIAALETPPVIVPPPVAPPATRPWPLPVVTKDWTVPSGMTIQAAVDAAADGTLLRFTGSFTIATAVNLQGRNNLILDFGGAVITNTAAPVTLATSYFASTFWWSWAGVKPTHITIRNLTVMAAHPKPGTLHPAEHAAVLHAMGGSFIELDNVTASGIFGDLLTANENPDHVWVHGCHVIDTGRNNVSVICGSDILIEDNRFDRAGYCAFDIEPESGSIAGAARVTFRRNAVGSWANAFVAVDGVDAGKPLSDITIAGNTCTGSLFSVIGGATGKARPQRVTFEDNTGNGGLISIRHADGVTVRRNPGTSLATSDCTGVVTS